MQRPESDRDHEENPTNTVDKDHDKVTDASKSVMPISDKTDSHTKRKREKKEKKRMKDKSKSKKDKKSSGKAKAKKDKKKKETSKKGKERDRDSSDSSSSSDSSDSSDDSDGDAPRSSITGKRIKLHREVTMEDRLMEIERETKRYFMNSQY